MQFIFLCYIETSSKAIYVVRKIYIYILDVNLRDKSNLIAKGTIKNI